MNGRNLTLGLVGALALTGLAMRAGSRDILSDRDLRAIAQLRNLPAPRGSRAKPSLLDLYAVSKPVAQQQHGRVVGKTRAKVNEGAMWRLAAEKLYGDYVDVPVVATREALQNSWDAIEKAIERRDIQPHTAAFRVSWDKDAHALVWEDNGIGMSETVVDKTFLSLGDTSKIATASRNELNKGGFGIAKAILLGASKTFTWELHSQNRRFVSDGFENDIDIVTAPFRQGVRLAVFNVDPKYDRFWSSSAGDSQSIVERIVGLLASCDAPFPIFFNGVRVEPAFSGDAQQIEIAEGANWGPKTTGDVRMYKRGSVGGQMILRLSGLTQFSRRLADGKADFDVVVDLETSIKPAEGGYPITASRMDLSGPAKESFDRLFQRLSVDVLSAARGPGAVQLGNDDVDPAKAGANEAAIDALMQKAFADPALQALLASSKEIRTIMDDVFRSVRGQEPVQQQGVSRAGTMPEAFRKMAEEVDADAPVAQRQQAKPTPVKPRGDGGSNPFAGAGQLKVNQAQWPAARLAPFLKPKAMLPILGLWRIAVRLVRNSEGLVYPFDVGFIFDDKVRAEFDPMRGTALFSLNPVAVVKLFQALPSNPAVIAAYVHNKACHEVTHALGYGDHNENFVAMRESVADRTAQLLAPLTLVTGLLLGMSTRGPRKKMAPRVSRVSYRSGRVMGLETFADGVAVLLTAAGFPAKVTDRSDYRCTVHVRAYNERYGDAERLTLTLYTDDMQLYGPWASFDNDGKIVWSTLLSGAERKLDDDYATQVLDLAPRLVRRLSVLFATANLRPLSPEEAGSLNRSSTSRRALLRQASTILGPESRR